MNGIRFGFLQIINVADYLQEGQDNILLFLLKSVYLLLIAFSKGF